jgi:urease accessory protein
MKPQAALLANPHPPILDGMSAHRRHPLQWPLVSFAMLLWPDDASAHTAIGGVTGFPGGILHPLLVPTHVMAIAVLAFLAARRAVPERRALISIFAAGLAGGIALVALAFATDYSDSILLAATLTGALVAALNIPLRFLVVAALAVVIALGLQFDSVPSTISVGETLLALLGAAIAALAEFILAMALIARAERPWQRIGLRIVSSWIAAVSLLMLALTFR